MWIRLKSIEIYGYHGAYPHEQEHGGRFEIDVELRADLSTAVVSDELTKTIDYARVLQAVQSLATAKRFHLIESLADAIARKLLAQFEIEEVIVRVRKPGVAIGGIVEFVEVECSLQK